MNLEVLGAGDLRQARITLRQARITDGHYSECTIKPLSRKNCPAVVALKRAQRLLPPVWAVCGCSLESQQNTLLQSPEASTCRNNTRSALEVKSSCSIPACEGGNPFRDTLGKNFENTNRKQASQNTGGSKPGQ